jgi:hypothetical protein
MAHLGLRGGARRFRRLRFCAYDRSWTRSERHQRAASNLAAVQKVRCLRKLQRLEAVFGGVDPSRGRCANHGKTAPFRAPHVYPGSSSVGKASISKANWMPCPITTGGVPVMPPAPC